MWKQAEESLKVWDKKIKHSGKRKNEKERDRKIFRWAGKSNRRLGTHDGWDSAVSVRPTRRGARSLSGSGPLRWFQVFSKEKLWGLTQPSSTALTRDIPTMVDILYLDPVSGWVDFLRISQNPNKGIHICLLTLSHTSNYAALWMSSSSLLNMLIKFFKLVWHIKVF